MPELKEIACEWCEKMFLPSRRGNIYCNTVCAEEAHHYHNNNPQILTEIACEWCKKIFMPKSINRIFCCKRCVSHAHRARHKVEVIEVSCLWCEKIFMPKDGRQKYCCEECRYEYTYSQTKKEKQTKLIEVNCLWCKKTFITNKSIQKYCSEECRYNHHYDENKKDIKESMKIDYYENRERYQTPKKRYAKLKVSAIKRDLTLTLTFEQFKELIDKPCFFCNDFFPRVKYAAGLDRINNMRGYDPDNVLPCCETCNKTRGDNWTIEEAKVMIQAGIAARGDKTFELPAKRKSVKGTKEYELECEWCHIKIMTKTRRNFCSRQCCKAAGNYNQKINGRDRTPFDRAQRACAYCKELFTPVNRNQIYCSKQCRNAQFYLTNQTQYNGRYIALKRTSYQRGLDINLSLEEYIEAVDKPCYYCDNYLYKKTIKCSGLDRLDNNLGYVRGNVVSCCMVCNQTRNNNWTPEETKIMIEIGIAMRKKIKE